MRMSNIKVKELLRDATELPVVVTMQDHIVHTTYVLIALLVAVPLLSTLIILNSPLFYYIEGKDLITFIVIGASSVIAEIALWMCKNYILNKI